MRILVGMYVLLAFSASAEPPAPPAEKPSGSGKSKKGLVTAPKQGIKTPGVQIPFASLKADVEIPVTSQWMVFAEPILIYDQKKLSLVRFDAKANKLGEPILDLNQPCGGAVFGFGSLWVPNCGDRTLARLDPKTWKVMARVESGVGSALPLLAASADSIWILSDDKTTLSRIDPDRNQVVAELRVAAGCNTLTFGEAALWLTCASENRVLRIDPQTNLVDQQIEVSAQPKAMAIGDGSIWVFCQKDGKVERIDPKTNKVTKTIETGVSGVAGSIAIGQGSVWVTQKGFAVTRIDIQTEKVVQQFWNASDTNPSGAIQFGDGSVWLSNQREGTLWRLDPKRIAATLAE